MGEKIQKAANDAPLKKNYAEVFLTPSMLMLEWDMTLQQARDFLDHHESWISKAMLDAGLDTVAVIARSMGLLNYDDEEREV